MTSLSITLPNDIAKASNEIAKKLGISRTAFIRQAVVHELNNFQTQIEQDDIIKSFTAMKESKQYLEEAEELIESLNSALPKESEEWWNKNKF
jgi:predicted transcriptional regulator